MVEEGQEGGSWHDGTCTWTRTRSAVAAVAATVLSVWRALPLWRFGWLGPVWSFRTLTPIIVPVEVDGFDWLLGIGWVFWRLWSSGPLVLCPLISHLLLVCSLVLG